MASLRASKKALRQAISKSLGSITKESVNRQSSIAASVLFGMNEYKNATRISVFLSMEGTEIQTDAIVRDALSAGKQVFVPYTYKATNAAEETPKSLMDMVRLQSLQDYETLERDKWGIPTPSMSSIAERENCFGTMGLSEGKENHAAVVGGLDLIIVPGMAFDKSLRRLGHGKGYYDYFLARYRRATQTSSNNHMPNLVAMALNEQILADGQSVPTDDSDWVVDVVITGKGELLR